MTSLSAEIFRQYDIRGIVDHDLTEDAVECIGRAIARKVGKGTLAVGRDCRTHSTRLSQALIRGITSVGLDAVDVGVVPTPTLYYALHHLDVHGGVQVTGSHNPPEYNGLKLSVGKESLHGDGIWELKAIAESARPTPRKGYSHQADVSTAYEAEIVSRISMGARRLKVVVDGGNGTAGPSAVSLLRRLGVEVVPLFIEMDGSFPNHHPDPTVEKNLLDLQRAVRRESADLGIAFDGDGDRIGVVDEAGEIIWGDRLMILFSRDVLAREPGATIIGEVKCSQVLYDEISRLGGRPVMWKAGHSLIKAKMAETQAALAGEMSGHIFFKNRWFGFDDATYSAARLLEIMSHTDKKLSELLSDVPSTCATPELRVDCPEALKGPVVRATIERFRARGMDVIDVDGARVSYGDGRWGLVRASNTTPILVLRFEAQTESSLAEIRADFEAELAAARQSVTTA